MTLDQLKNSAFSRQLSTQEMLQARGGFMGCGYNCHSSGGTTCCAGDPSCSSWYCCDNGSNWNC